MRGRGVHDVDPDRQRELTAKCAAINFLWLVEAGPNRAGELAVVTGEECVREIVGGPGFSCGRKFLETKFRTRSFAGAVFKRVDQTGMNFVRALGLDCSRDFIFTLRVPDNSSIFFFDPV